VVAHGWNVDDRLTGSGGCGAAVVVVSRLLGVVGGTLLGPEGTGCLVLVWGVVVCCLWVCPCGELPCPAVVVVGGVCAGCAGGPVVV
jgi:hypothetical protein